MANRYLSMAFNTSLWIIGKSTIIYGQKTDPGRSLIWISLQNSILGNQIVYGIQFPGHEQV